MAISEEIVSDEQALKQNDARILRALNLDAHDDDGDDSLVGIVLSGQRTLDKFLRHETMPTCIQSALLPHRWQALKPRPIYSKASAEFTTVSPEEYQAIVESNCIGDSRSVDGRCSI
jgi:hypothetical protein